MTDVELSYTEHGPRGAPVVVLSNSLGADRGMWDPQVPALAERYRVVTYDTRAHGGSPSPSGPYSIDDLADDLVALLERVAAERAHVVGLSLGGMTAMRLAAREPARIGRLVLLCTSAKVDGESFRERAAAVRTGGTGPLAPTIVSRWLTPGYAEAHPHLVARLEGMVASADDAGYAACCEAIADMDLTADLARIAAPTLVISGADDPALPPEHQQRIVEGVANSSLLTVRPGAHLANLEQSLQVTGAILGHLEGAR